MKIRLLLAAFLFAPVFLLAQTATDFTATACSGTSHNLFSELNSGKVIVICWVMPCGSCTGPALTTLNVVNSYVNSHPNTVYMYLCDDYGNTSCTSLESWKNSNGLSSAISFSDGSINMADYGSAGMPKIVVIGGGSHTVFYNTGNTVDASALQSAINNALSVAGINEPNKAVRALSVSPNPSTEKAVIKFELFENADVQVRVLNLQGKLVSELYSKNFSKGENEAELNVRDLANGTYLVQVGNDSESSFINLVVSR